MEIMKMRSVTLTLVLVNLAGIMERADETLLPAVYREIGSALDTDPTGLGSLTLFRSIVQTACYPLAAYLAVRHNRAHVIALGAFLWAGATFLVGVSSTFFQVAVSRALNGIGLAIVVPAIQSLVADSTYESNRGLAFGWLQLTGNFGSIFGNLCGVLLASTSFLGIPGWRIAFHLIGIISLVVGLLVRVFANDPRFVDENLTKCPKPSGPSFCSELKEVLQEAKSVIKIPTFQIFVAQGVLGSFPWSALSFAPMWLELIGFSHETTAFLMTAFVIGGSLGGLFGGKLGDVLSTRLPNAGRIILSQISAGSGIPLAAILLLGLPDDPSKAFLYGFVLFTMGFFNSWNGPATNMPIFAEIVPEKQRTSVYALDCCFESILASFAPPIVGILAQHVYGYKHAVSTATEIETDKENATSLAKALYTSIGIPFAICVSIYSFLYRTYPRDKERARMQAFIESEIQLIGEEEAEAAACRRNSLTSVDQELRFSGEELVHEEGKGLKDDDRSVVDVRYYSGAGDESAEFDDSDEMSLLPDR